MKYIIYIAALFIIGSMLYQLSYNIAYLVGLTSNVRANLGAEMYDEPN